MEPRLIQTQSQQLILSPQLRQYLKLLQLPLLELHMSIQDELAQNPVLEEAEEIPQTDSSQEDERDDKDLKLEEVLNRLDSLDEDARESLYHYSDLSEPLTSDLVKKHDYQENILTSKPTLANYLTWQLGLLNLTEDEHKIAEEIIGDINDDGYLTASIEEIATALKISPSAVEKILKIVQGFDPPGVGGRTITEVLLIQLERNQAGALPKKIVEQFLPQLQRKQMDQIASALATTVEHVSSACQVISKLEPKPGRIFYQDNAIAVIPDIIISRVEKENGTWEYAVDINNETIPELRVNKKYRQMLKQKNLDQKTKIFLREKVQAAMMFIRVLGERKSTLRQIAEELVMIQKEFLDQGFAFLKPLKLRDIAEKLGIHESTISRAINGKYVQCPQGTISLRSFFSTSLTMEDGTVESQKSLLEKLKHLIESEDKKKPLSDAQLVEILKRDGTKLARRTVAKYREILKILPTHLRKEK